MFNHGVAEMNNEKNIIRFERKKDPDVIINELLKQSFDYANHFLSTQKVKRSQFTYSQYGSYSEDVFTVKK